MRQYTEDEVRKNFLDAVKTDVAYWNKVPPNKEYTKEYTCLDRLNGLAFSIMALLDGCADLPPFIVSPNTNTDHNKFLKKLGENWYPNNENARVKCDIGGDLHEYFKSATGNEVRWEKQPPNP